MKYLTASLVLAMTLSLPHWAWAQKKIAKPYKPPVLTSKIGSFSGKAIVAKEEALQVIAYPLTITDANNATYTISSFQFLYRQITQTEDEKTGQVIPASSIAAERFRQTPLPALWINSIKEKLKSGEEICFLDIIVKDKEGRVMYAPDLTLKIK